MFKETNIIDFAKRFGDEDSCYQHLAEMKWHNGYNCKRCGNENFCKGRSPYSRRCTKCKHDESATAHTLYHKVKFPLQKAFYITYLVMTTKKDISSYELSRKLDLRQKSCWLFKKKILELMNNNQGKREIILEKVA